MKKLLTALVFSAGLLMSLTTKSATLEFDCISDNSASDCAIGETQLSGELTETFAGGALFKFFNDGSDAMFIDGVYFYDGVYLDDMLAMGSNASSVNFSEDATPADLPAYGGDLAVYYSADADAPAPENGVWDGEWIAFNFSLVDGILFEDVLAAVEEGDLGFGLKVQGFESGGSETYWGGCSDGVCNGGEDVPEVPVPAAAWLFGSGLLGLVGVARRRNKS